MSCFFEEKLSHLVADWRALANQAEVLLSSPHLIDSNWKEIKADLDYRTDALEINRFIKGDTKMENAISEIIAICIVKNNNPVESLEDIKSSIAIFETNGENSEKVYYGRCFITKKGVTRNKVECVYRIAVDITEMTPVSDRS